MAIEYTYKAVSGTGQIEEGTYTSTSKEDVVRMLREKNLRPMKIAEQKTLSKEVSELTIFKPRVKLKDLTIFCKQFQTMLNAGMALTNCLEVLMDQTDNKTLKEVVSDLYSQVQKGSMLSEAMKKHKKIFPPLLINMVEAGEMTGTLDDVLTRMAEHFEKENKIQSKIKGAMTYPMILSVLSILIVTFLLVFIMPTFVGMFTSSGVELPGPTRLLMNMSDALQSYWYLFLLVIGGIVFGIKSFAGTEEGKRALDQLKFKIPIVKGAIAKIVTARFTRTLSTLLASGISIIPALEASANVTNNKVVIDGMNSVVEDIRKGIALAPLFNRMGVFPPMMVSMVSIGEESGSLDSMLAKTADFYDQELEQAIQQLTSMIEPLMIVVMALVVGFIVISMMLPIFDMVKTIS